MSADSYNTIKNKYLEDMSIYTEDTKPITNYLDTKDLKKNIDLLDELLA